jgi:IPT/TIG domain
MALSFQNVLPGDLITASEMNQILQALMSLDSRVTALEGSAVSAAGVIISALIPPSGTVTVGNVLTVIGSNFGFSAGADRVYIDDTPVNAFNPGSSDTQLIFNIPNSIVDVPQQGRPATLTVSNQTSTAQRTLTLMPAMVLTGAIDVVSQGVTPATITAGQNVTFAFLLHSRANLDATCALSATVNVAANQAAWQSNLQIMDSSGNVLQSGQILVPASQSVPFSVGINPVPPGTNGTQFTITVNLTAGNITGTSGPTATQTVGQSASQPDTTISLNYSSSLVSPTGSGSVTASQIQLPSGSSAKVSLNATFTVAGAYNLTVVQVAPATNWQVQLLASTTPSPYSITQAQLANPQGSASVTLDFTVQRPNGATSGQIEFTVQRQGVTQSRTFIMALIAS